MTDGGDRLGERCDEVSALVSVLVLGTAEWNAPIATNQQYVVRELASSPCLELQFMESMALRKPKVNRADLARILDRLSRAVRFASAETKRPARRKIPKNVRVRSTLVVPLHTGLPALLNHKLLRTQVREWLTFPGKRVLLTYTPVTYGLEDEANATIYHCVDLLGKVEGIDSALIDFQESRLGAKGVTAIATSNAVRKHLISQGFAAPLLMENVADTRVYERFASQLQTRRGAIFAGNLTTTKLDLDLLRTVADAGVHLTLAGPLGAGTEPGGSLWRLMNRDNVKYLGLLGPEELAAAFSTSAVGLVPYALNEYTMGVSPLKVYEYLASGLPVVSTQLPGVHACGRDVQTLNSVEFLAQTVAFTADHATQGDIDRRVGIAQSHSWTDRGREIRALIERLLRQSLAGSPLR